MALGTVPFSVGLWDSFQMAELHGLHMGSTNITWTLFFLWRFVVCWSGHSWKMRSISLEYHHYSTKGQVVGPYWPSIWHRIKKLTDHCRIYQCHIIILLVILLLLLLIIMVSQPYWKGTVPITMVINHLTRAACDDPPSSTRHFLPPTSDYGLPRPSARSLGNLEMDGMGWMELDPRMGQKTKQMGLPINLAENMNR